MRLFILASLCLCVTPCMAKAKPKKVHKPPVKPAASAEDEVWGREVHPEEEYQEPTVELRNPFASVKEKSEGEKGKPTKARRSRVVSVPNPQRRMAMGAPRQRNRMRGKVRVPFRRRPTVAKSQTKFYVIRR